MVFSGGFGGCQPKSWVPFVHYKAKSSSSGTAIPQFFVTGFPPISQNRGGCCHSVRIIGQPPPRVTGTPPTITNQPFDLPCPAYIKYAEGGPGAKRVGWATVLLLTLHIYRRKATPHRTANDGVVVCEKESV